MAKNNDFKLEQTKGAFKLVGKVTRIDGEKAYNEGTVGKGRFQGSEYRSVRFGIKTSETNEIFVELFGMELDFVYPYSQKDKKSQKIPFSQRHNTPEGYHIIGVGLGLEKDDEGKNIRKSMVEFDAVEYIYNNLEVGDSVVLGGKIEYSTYKNQQDQDVEQKKYIIGSVFKTKNEIDFEADKFEETSDFEQDIIFVDAMKDDETGKTLITGRTIAYADKWQDASFVIAPEGDKDLEKLANTFLKKLKFGDAINVFGNILNRTEIVDAGEVEEDDDNPFGGKSKPKSLQKNTVKNFTQELRITGVDATKYLAKKYNEDDFFVEELVEEKVDMKDNPFLNDDDGENSDDLPF